MKPLIKILFILLSTLLFNINQAQDSASRFFYELSYKPNKDSAKISKQMVILDITDRKSIYRDYLSVSQDSIILDAIQKSQKAGVRLDIEKIYKIPKFTYKIIKNNILKQVNYTDMMLQDQIGYIEPIGFKWKIEDEKININGWDTQKATTSYAGRKWIAWFTTKFPFQDGPYKFSGLPGLIVRVEDEFKNYSWVLTGIEKILNYNENSLMEQGSQSKDPLIVSKEQFLKIFRDYRNNPLGSVKGNMTADKLSQKMPDGRTMAEVLRTEEEKLKKMLNENNNDIEIYIKSEKIKSLKKN